jgi:hypothetical protein
VDEFRYLGRIWGHGAGLGDRRVAHWALVLRPEGERQFLRIKHNREDNIKMDLQVVGWRRKNWADVADKCKCGNELSGSVKCGEFLDYLSTC